MSLTEPAPRLLDAALEFAARGWPVFPCQWNRDRPGAKYRKEKSPLVRAADKDGDGKTIPKTGGLWRASTNEAQIRAWWDKWPLALIAVPTGAKIGAFVVDLDTKGETAEEVEQRLIETVGPLPAGPRSRTQSGGVHLWFRVPLHDAIPRNSAKRIRNVDWRGDGGYVIVPPSAMSDGAAYTWIVDVAEIELPTPPPKLIDLLLHRGEFAGSVTSAPSRPSDPTILGANSAGVAAVRAYARKALDRMANDVREAKKGTRGHELNAAAYGVAPFVALGVLSEREVVAALRDSADASGLTAVDGTAERDAKIKRGLEAGRHNIESLAPRLEEIRRRAEMHQARHEGSSRSQSSDGHGGAVGGGVSGRNLDGGEGDDDGDDLPVNSEERLALEYAAQHALRLRFIAALGRWKWWTGTYWRDDNTLAAFCKIRPLVRAAARQLETAKAQIQTASAKTVNGVHTLARSDPRLSAVVDQWDADPFALNTPAGIVDLRSGIIGPHRAEAYCAKITAVAPEGDCPGWREFIHEIFAGDADLIAFVQRKCGYILTGSTRDQAFFFYYGGGANGKSTFIGALEGALGAYATTAPAAMFMATDFERHSTELARLCGARLVSVRELDEGQRWAEAKIKALTGGDRVTARFMRQDDFEFTPQFKLLIAGNHKPSLRGVDEAMRRRLYLVPFNVTIPSAQRDPKLPEKLRAEWPGILAWAIQGCLEWQRIGLAPPTAVRAATDAYMAREDGIAVWLDECTELDQNAWSSTSELFRSWHNWAHRAGEFIGSEKRFVHLLEARGFRWERRKSGRGFWGLRLLPQASVSDQGYGGTSSGDA